ncbi:hypothetical protein, conserved [Babesia bigemina]|uniref:Uncharacterized protein n=1 Tax=Babesia bigemina TaxID=5866 RepID=A0A061DCK7_BABBI|nr:hypothetical protein, conserved [Babesia bigemina]CDR97837.1 hypothetical protein, conserved [Babesia bigemina]|eukprot:XP_012770023.1 hypothetical protein, conserved [Babesia bigemina]
MDGRGDPWGGNNPAFTRKVLHTKMMPKGLPYMMQMVTPQGMYPKGGNASNMMMPPGGKTAPMPPSRMPLYPESVGHMPKMLGKLGPGYMPTSMQMDPRGVMPQDRMPNLPAHMSYRGSTGNSPVGMAHQRVPPRQLQPGPGAMAHVPSPTSVGHGIMAPGMHPGMSPRGMAPNMSPSSMGQNHQAPAAMPSNVSPKNLQRYTPDPRHPHAVTMGNTGRGTASPHYASQMMGPPKMGPMAMPMGGMKVQPGPASGMGFMQVPPPGSPHMVMSNRRPNMMMAKPRMPMDMGPGSHMKSPSPVSGVNFPVVAAQPSGFPRPTSQPPKPTRTPPKRTGESRADRSIGTPQSGSSDGALALPKDVPMVDSDAAEKRASQIIEQMEKCLLELLSEQLKKAEGLYGKTFTVDESEVTSALIKGFLPILGALWREIKESHKYSLDELYLELNNPDAADKCGVVVNRELRSLEEYYRTKRDIEKVLNMYRSRTKPANKDNNNANAAEDQAATAATRAQEYAEVGYNQRHLVQKITALDYRNALAGDRCKSMMPESFRVQQIKMASSLHFDIRTPPQCISPPPEAADSNAAEIALSKCANSMDTSQFPSIALKLLDRSKHNRMDKGGDVPMLPMDMRYAKTPGMALPPEVMMQMPAVKPGFAGMPMHFPKGMNFPMMQMAGMMPMGPGVPPGMPAQFGHMGMGGVPGKQVVAPVKTPTGKQPAGVPNMQGKHGGVGPQNIPGQPGGLNAPGVPPRQGSMGIQMPPTQLGAKSFQGLHGKQNAMMMQGQPSQLGPMGFQGAPGKQVPKGMHGPPGKHGHLGKHFIPLMPGPQGKHGPLMPQMSGVKPGPPKPPIHMGMKAHSQQVGAPMPPPTMHPMMLKHPPPVFGSKYN